MRSRLFLLSPPKIPCAVQSQGPDNTLLICSEQLRAYWGLLGNQDLLAWRLGWEAMLQESEWQGPVGVTPAGVRGVHGGQRWGLSCHLAEASDHLVAGSAEAQGSAFTQENLGTELFSVQPRCTSRVLYLLASFGIPYGEKVHCVLCMAVRLLPIPSNGEIVKSNHCRWSLKTAVTGEHSPHFPPGRRLGILPAAPPTLDSHVCVCDPNRVLLCYSPVALPSSLVPSSTGP